MSGSPSSQPRAALVTGASRGIGRFAALQLAHLGYDIAANFRVSATEAEEVVEAVRSLGREAVALQADMAVPEEASELVARTEEALGPLYVAINNAGITRDRLLVQMSEADWDIIWLTDLAGPRALGRAALRSMCPRGCGRIVNISSVVGNMGNAGQANYATAKAALLGLTRELALLGAESNVTVNCVVPGYITTDATAYLTPEQQDAWLERIPMSRAATPSDIADAVSFFVSDQASYITGQCIAVDGGLQAQAGAGLVS